MPSSFLIGAIITIALIVMSFLVGYKIIEGIESFHGKKRGIDIYNKLNELVNYLYYQTEGSSKIAEISLSNEEILCFINYDDVVDYASHTYLNVYDKEYLIQIIGSYNSRNLNNKPNIYYHMKDQMPQTYFIKHLIPVNTFCLNKTSQIYFENKGDYISVEMMQ